MSIVNNKTDAGIKASVISLELVLSLLFPNYQLMKMPTMLVLTKQVEGHKDQVLINNDNFEQFKGIVKSMFCLDTLGGSDYNPANKTADMIAKKLRARHKKLSKKQEGSQSIDILSRYVSILTLANHHTIPELMQYTVFQLFDQFRRFEKKYSYDTWFKAKLAGAQNLQDVDSWLADEEKVPQARPKSGRIEF